MQTKQNKKPSDQSTLQVEDPETSEKGRLRSTMLLQEGSEVGSWYFH